MQIVGKTRFGNGILFEVDGSIGCRDAAVRVAAFEST